MGGYVLSRAQDRAVTQLVDLIEDALDADGDELLLQAPTGAGKTVMVGSVLERLAGRGREFVVLWVTPGKGDLAGQSEARLRAVLAGCGDLTVGMLDEPYLAGHPVMAVGDVRVVNWEKIASGDINRLAKGGDKPSFYDVIAATARSGVAVIVVVDEAHRNAGKDTQSAGVLRQLQALGVGFIKLSVTATPDANAHRGARLVQMRYSDVVRDELVRVGVTLNAELGMVAQDDGVYRRVLDAAWARLNLLTGLYEQAGSPVRPLMLVQYDADTMGKDNSPYRDAVAEFLADKGILGTDKHARWFSGEQVNVAGIAENSSPVRVLEFKQAIDTGWDCPRAQVLVQFREPKSSTFRIQTLGRFLRAPERKHYPDRRLNVAYVYSNLDVDVTIDPQVDAAEVKFWVEATRDRTRYQSLNLTCAKKRPARTDVPPTLKDDLFNEWTARVLPLLPTEPERQIVGTVAADRYFEGAALHYRQATAPSGSGQTVSVLTGDEACRVINVGIEEAIVGFNGKRASIPMFRGLLAEWVWAQPGRGNWTFDECLYTVQVHAKAELVDTIKAVTGRHHVASLTTPVVVTSGWEVPLKWLVVDDSNRCGDGYLFNPPFIDGDRSAPEQAFEGHLERLTREQRVSWWWKNGVHGESLGVPYHLHTSNGEQAPGTEVTYPDYLIMLTTGVLWVVEIKSVNDPGGAVWGETHSKALGLHQWANALPTDREPDPSAQMLPGFTFPKVEAALIVPCDGQLYRGFPDNWHPPTPEHLHGRTGWDLFTF